MSLRFRIYWNESKDTEFVYIFYLKGGEIRSSNSGQGKREPRKRKMQEREREPIR